MSDSTKLKNVAHSMYTNGVNNMNKLFEIDKKIIGGFEVNDKDTICTKISTEFNNIKTSYGQIDNPPTDYYTKKILESHINKINNFIKTCNNSSRTIIDQLNIIERMFINYINNSIDYIIYNETKYELDYMNIIVGILEHFILTYDSSKKYIKEEDLVTDYSDILDDSEYVRFCDYLKYYYNKILLLIKGFNESIKSDKYRDENNKLKDIYTKANKIIDNCNNDILKMIERMILSISNNYVNKLNSIDTIYVNLQDSNNIFYCPTYLNEKFTVDLENKEVKESIKNMVDYCSDVNKKIRQQLQKDIITITNFNTIKYDLYGLIFYRKMCKFSPYRNTNLMGINNIPNLSSIQTDPFDKKDICFCCALPVNYQEMIQKLNFDYKVNIRYAYIKTANVMYYIKNIIDNLITEESTQIRNEKICEYYDSGSTSNCDYNGVEFELILNKYETIVSRDISSYHRYIFQSSSDKNKITESSLNKFTDNNLLVGNMMRSSEILNNAIVNSHSFDELINAIDPNKGSWVLTFIIGLIVGILSVVGSIFFVIKKNGTEVSTENELKLKKKKIKTWYIVCLIGLILSLFILAISLIVLYSISKNSPANKIRAEILVTAIFIIISFGYLIFFNWYYLNDKVKIKLVVKTPGQTPAQTPETPGQTN